MDFKIPELGIAYKKADSLLGTKISENNSKK